MAHKRLLFIALLMLAGLSLAPAALTAAQQMPSIIFVKQVPVSATVGTIASTFNNVQGFLPAEAEPVGGGLFRMDPDGTVTDLTPFDGIAVRDPEISYDGQKVIFAMKRGGIGKWQLYEMNVDGTGLHQFNLARNMNFWDPSYLPDGRILFLSDRLEAIARVNDNIPKNELPEGMLFVMNPDGSNIQIISANPHGTFNPEMGQDGLIYFTQWDLNDLRASPDDPPDGVSYSRFLVWEAYVDGSREGHPIFGNHLVQDFAGGFMDVREIPDGSGDMVATWAQARFTYGAGGIVRFHPHGDEDLFHVTWLTPQEGYSNLAGNTSGRYRSPYPLQDGRVIASYASGSVWDDGSGTAPDFDLVMLNPDGTHTVLLKDPDFWDWQPVEIAPRPMPAITAPLTLPQDGSYAIINTEDVDLRNINTGEVPNSDDQPAIAPGQAAAVRIYTLGRPVAPYAGGDPNHQELTKVLLGTVPVQPDGSFAAVVPAHTQLMWDVVDKDGNMLVTERVWSELAPGEVRTCRGCHTPYDQTGRTTNTALLNPTNLTGLNVDTNNDGIVDLLEAYMNQQKP